MSTPRAALAALIVLACAVGAGAQCLDGDYAVVGDPLLSSPGGAFARDVVTIAGDTVAIASGCPAVRARIRTTSSGTVIRASWAVCGSVARRVRLRAIVNKPCKVMRGRLVTRSPRAVRRFVARHVEPGPPDDGTGSGCATNAGCAASEYCAKPAGACAATGQCAARPAACPRDRRPVCGCDGLTYSNPCDAAASGVPVGREGACPDRCGTIGGIPCPDGEYCDLAPGLCGGADLAGRCVPVGDACIALWDPVCGCDGNTYGNDCERVRARVQKAHDGRCEPRPCGGIAGVSCEPGEVCELPKGECQGADLQGVCVPVPKLCPDLRAPVCGCDGVTYGNECERLAAGVQHAHPGPCGAPCESACDCEKAQALPEWCALLLCPACACAWTCEQGRCAVEVRSPVPPPACG